MIINNEIATRHMRALRFSYILALSLFFLFSGWSSAGVQIAYAQGSGPDIIPEDIWWSPDPALAGQDITIAFRLRNVGNQAAPPFHIQIYRDGQKSCEWLIVNGLAPGEAFARGPGLSGSTCFGAYGIPSAQAPGYNIRFEVDDLSQVTETNESNNSIQEFVPIGGGASCTPGGACTLNSCPGTYICQNNQRVCQDTPNDNCPASCTPGGSCTTNNCPGTYICQNNQRVCQDTPNDNCPASCTPGGACTVNNCPGTYICQNNQQVCQDTAGDNCPATSQCDVQAAVGEAHRFRAGPQTAGTPLDPDQDQIYYVFDWGDNQTTRVPAGGATVGSTVSQESSHSWGTVGAFMVGVRAFDQIASSQLSNTLRVCVGQQGQGSNCTPNQACTTTAQCPGTCSASGATCNDTPGDNCPSTACTPGGACTLNNCPGTYICQNNQRVCQDTAGDNCPSGGGGGGTPLPGDFNGDQRIDIIDLAYLLQQWGIADPKADLNADGTVDILDYTTWLAYWLAGRP